MKNVILTTDLSSESKQAFELAKTVVRGLQAKLTILAVIEDLSQAAMVYAMDFPILPDPKIQKELAEKVKTELAEIKKTYFADLESETVVREARGPVHTEILNCAKELGADLIIMATHGRTGLTRLLIGSVTEKVVREAQCPVLTVPTRAK